MAARRAGHHRARRPRSSALAAQRARLRRRLFRAGALSAWARRIGTLTPAARSSASRAAPRPPTSPGRRWSRWPIRPATCSRRCRTTPACALAELKVDGGAAVNDRPDAVPGRPAGRAAFAGRWWPRRRPWGRPIWPAWPSAIGRAPTRSRGTGRWTASSCRRCPRPSATGCTPGGSKRSSAARDWQER